MLYGAGSLFLLSTELDVSSIRGQQLVFPACVANFELSTQASLAEAKCLIDGKKQTTAARITEETSTLKLTFEKAGWQELAFAFDELAQSSASIVLPQTRVGTVVADTTGGKIVDSTLTADDATVLAYESKPIARFLKRIPTAGTPVAGEYEVATGKLGFPSSSIGSTISYSVNKTYTSIESIGEEANYDSFGKLIFSGFVYTTEDSKPLQIVVPELQRVSVPTFGINGSLSALEIEFRAAVAPGQRRAFKLYRLQGAS